MRFLFLNHNFFQRSSEFFSYYLQGLSHRIDEHHVFLISGGLAFSIFTCIVPFILIIFSILGMLLESPAVETQINAFIDTFIPYQKTGEIVKEIISSRLMEFKIFKTLAGYLGVFGLLFAASGLFTGMRSVLNTIFGVEKNRHTVIGLLRDLLMVLLVIAFFLLSTTFLPGLEVIKDSAGKYGIFKLLHLKWIYGKFISTFSFLLIFTVFYGVYYFVPYAKLKKRVIIVSAIWTAVMWEIAKQIFGYYITHFATLTKIYGTYFFIVVVAFWLYYGSVVFVLGAEIGQLYRERHAKRFLVI